MRAVSNRSGIDAVDRDRLDELMRSAQAGDSVAYARLLAAIAPLIRRTIRRQRQLMPAADVEDIVQETLLSVHAVRATYDANRPFLPWLMAILRNRMVDGTRRYARLSAHEIAVDPLPETFADEDTNTMVERHDRAAVVRRAVRDLPKRQRVAVEMLKLQELSLKEAASASGMSISALKVAVHRGMKGLRARLRGEA
ncbi:MAG: sigma-70 family RNA polymerase sigma factor [Alphaproteobacteria bacterium]|nr:sigma-70 family RNA polymerase sigma factor [Alphaproteobacteria bacterium]